MVASLASTLRTFPLFAGRLITDDDQDYAVALNGAGASFTVATSDANLSDLLPETTILNKTLAPNDSKNSDGKAMPGSPLALADLSQFIPQAPDSILDYHNRDVPLLFAQVTALQGSGTVLGVVVPHFLADQVTCRVVLKAWAQNYTAACAAKAGAGASEKKQEPTAPAAVRGTAPLAGAPEDDNDPDIQELMLGRAMEPYAASEIPSGWTPAQFEHRTWKYIPLYFGAMLWNRLTSGPPETVLYYVSEARLAELKDEAMKMLPKASGAPKWISTNDALAARIQQAIGELPRKYRKKELHVVMDLRKRMTPAMSQPALGNATWRAIVHENLSNDELTTSRSADTAAATARSELPPLGLLAADIRSAINNGLENTEFTREYRWLQDNMQQGATIPLVFADFKKLVNSHEGPLLLSHWNWGERGYDDLQFGGGPETASIWHQYACAPATNCVFVVPAGTAAPAGGVLVNITLHRTLAHELRKKTPIL